MSYQHGASDGWRLDSSDLRFRLLARLHFHAAAEHASTFLRKARWG